MVLSHRRHSACNPGARENDLRASRHLSAPSAVSPVGRAHASVGRVSSAAAFYASIVGRQSAKCAQQATARAENSSKPLSTGTAVCLPASSAQAVDHINCLWAGQEPSVTLDLNSAPGLPVDRQATQEALNSPCAPSRQEGPQGSAD